MPEEPPDPECQPLEELTVQPFKGWSAILSAPNGVRLPPTRAIVALVCVMGIALAIGLTVMRGTVLNVQKPSLQVDSILSVRLEGTGTAHIRVASAEMERVFGERGASRWQAARLALPSYLEPVSPLYHIAVNGTGIVRLDFTIPEPTLDVYRWDEEGMKWVFVPAEVNLEANTLSIEPIPDPVALFRSVAGASLIGAFLEGEQPPSEAESGALSMVLIPDVVVGANGLLQYESSLQDGQLPGYYAVLSTVRISEGGSLNGILGSETAWQAHASALASLLRERDLNGIVLDCGEVDAAHAEAFYALLDDLSQVAGEEGKLLGVRVPPPSPLTAGWDMGIYDLQRLADYADLIIVTPPGNPAQYVPGGLADEFMRWACSRVERLKLAIAFSSLSVDEWAGQMTTIPYEYALRPLGPVGLIDLAGEDVERHPGEVLTFGLEGDATHIEWDPASQTYSYTVYAGDGEHHVWIMTAGALRNRLEWAASYHVGGIVVEDLFAEGNAPNTLEAVEAFKARLPSTLSTVLTLRWTVSDASGAELNATTIALGTPLAWVPGRGGRYVVSAELEGQQPSPFGTVEVAVYDPATGLVPGQRGVVAGAPTLPVDFPTPVPLPAGMPPPVVQAGAVGNFELGGQVNHQIVHPELMRQAGMRWVKYQLAWTPEMPPSEAGALIRQGRQMGFKVLLSITGRDKYPTSIDTNAYINFLRGVAYYGPDAIEVWNEENLDFEWPRGQIDGGRYVRGMLAPAFNAIKEINPNIMVISGALAPTGAFYGEGGCSAQGFGCDDWLYLQQMAQAGAASYLDCVGAHYNTGATPPSASTGHPGDPGYGHYSWYFGGMLQLYAGTFGRPVCFTELGYLTGEGYGAVPDRYSWAADNTLEDQAAWLAEAAQLSMQSRQVRLMIVWNVDFVYWGNDDPMAGYAIVRPDGRCPACEALDRVMP